VQDGDAVAIAGERIRFEEVRPAVAVTTDLRPPSLLPVEVRFTFLGDGGRLWLRYPTGEADLKLPELRARLFATLLSGCGAASPGDWMDDDLVIPRVWPRHPGKTNFDLNVLVHRARKALVAAGVNAFALLQRENRATRFCLHADTRVAVS
jgi:hypothetical protein